MDEVVALFVVLVPVRNVPTPSYRFCSCLELELEEDGWTWTTPYYICLQWWSYQAPIVTQTTAAITTIETFCKQF